MFLKKYFFNILTSKKFVQIKQVQKNKQNLDGPYSKMNMDDQPICAPRFCQTAPQPLLTSKTIYAPRAGFDPSKFTIAPQCITIIDDIYRLSTCISIFQTQGLGVPPAPTLTKKRGFRRKFQKQLGFLLPPRPRRPVVGRFTGNERHRPARSRRAYTAASRRRQKPPIFY